MQAAPENTPHSTPADSETSGTHSGAGTPQYGEFGHAPGTSAQPEQSMTQGGQAAPPVNFPEQRGSTPENLDPEAVRAVAGADYDEQREGWAKDDPRYGSGHRDPNPGDTEEAKESGHNPNAGNNDNPDEFSALRPDKGRGIPGSGK